MHLTGCVHVTERFACASANEKCVCATPCVMHKCDCACGWVGGRYACASLCVCVRYACVSMWVRVCV